MVGKEMMRAEGGGKQRKKLGVTENNLLNPSPITFANHRVYLTKVDYCQGKEN